VKTLLLASTIVACTGIGSAFASVTVYADGSTYDPVATAAQSRTMCPGPGTCATGTCAASTDTAPGLSHTARVVLFGPPETGNGGGGKSSRPIP
jgi:hypothetical protein